ncbi:hypothetical protein K505DRAFT_327492 [Melanomma pulvis-pyrius CBS 109.77]|uniref:SGNH hydrolase n=1 Tax=Melanomma pulvis-pyrius CBS 109.77 TaxID=1314802 RepID=A0A6A6X2K2_9PLEO|nr:hypothetical protein K505DRAFT_327492 [Melanomma pulvis-pyrius CBS 109.77]
MGVLARSIASSSATSADTPAPRIRKPRVKSNRKINLYQFYTEWRGHPIDDLGQFLDLTLAQRPDKPIIYLAGDSSLDNKYWVPSSGPGGDPLPVEVPEIYYKTLDRPRPKPDVSFWLNHVLGGRATCVNTAVEETTLRDRDESLLEHDEFIRDNIRDNDILIVSIGANDIALRPSPATIIRMLQMAWLTQFCSLENGSAYALPYFKELFGPKIQNYVSRLTSRTKPRAVIVSMIYFPLEWAPGQTSWANAQLKALRYDSYPEKLQMAIRQMYEIATKSIRIEGTEVLPCALFEVLDGKEKSDYTDRVEPSVEGGKKMAVRFVEILEGII